jgi:membrane fusion protein, copper/silver efflux system
MTRIWLASAVGLAAGGLLVAGLTFRFAENGAPAHASADHRVLFYRDPMHPAYTSDRPGKAPDCGMDLVPVFANDPEAVRSAGNRATVKISADRQQLIGVRLGTVEASVTKQTLRTLGRVAADETRVFPLLTSSEGWVTQIFSAGSGTTVQKGQPLLAVYGRDYTTAERTFIYALRTFESSPRAIASGEYQDQPALALQEARLSLEVMGFGEAQIRELSTSRQVSLGITLTAPASGIVISWNLFPGQRFDKGTELLRIADLSKVWIIADLVGDEAQFVRAGATARVSVPGHGEKTFQATVSGTLSTFDPQSRSLKVRLEVSNPGLELRPAMFVDLEFPLTLPKTTTVPAEALIDTGEKKIVFVHHGQNVFEPRAVETGWHFGDRVQIVHGLNPGESIVVSGNFLVDSESRMGGLTGPHD